MSTSARTSTVTCSGAASVPVVQPDTGCARRYAARLPIRAHTEPGACALHARLRAQAASNAVRAVCTDVRYHGSRSRTSYVESSVTERSSCG